MSKSDFRDFVSDGICRTDSVGLLAYESDELIVLLQSVGETQVADAIKIARTAIKEIREIGNIDVAFEVEAQEK